MSSTAFRSEPIDRGLVSALNPILTGLGALYFALLINHTVLQPNLEVTPLVFLGSATTLLLVGTRFAVQKWALPGTWAESASSVIAGIVLLHCVLHIYLLSNFLEATNLGLLGAGITCFFLPPRRLSLVLTVTLGTWLVLAVFTTPSAAWLYFAFGLFAAAGLRVHTECHNAGISKSLERAKEEISKRESIESALRLSEERFALAAEACNDGLWDWNLKNGQVYYSGRWRRMAGLGESDVAGPRDWFGRVHPEDIEPLRAKILSHLNGRARLFEAEYRMLHSDGRPRWMLARAVTVRDSKGKALRLAGSQTEITEKKAFEQQLMLLAYYDELTRMPNRSLFLEKVAAALRQSARNPNHHFAILMLDLDGFRSVNEVWGHTVGDWVLQSCAARLKRRVAADRESRLGADAFALMLEDVANPMDALSFAESIREELAAPFVLEDGRKIFLTVSIGVTWGSGGKDPQELLRCADAALHRAKQHGGNRCELYNPKVRFSSMDRIRLQDDIHGALERNELQVQYRPIVNLSNQRIISLEATPRWAHASLGLINSEQLLSVAEECGLLNTIGKWCVESACAQMGAWRKEFPNSPIFGLCLKVRGRQAMDVRFAETTMAAVKASGLPPKAVRLQVTEDVFLQNEALVMAQLWELQESGVEFYLDQFGSRRSPLNCLDRFPFAAVKIDRSLTNRVTTPEGRRILEALVSLVQDLSMEPIVDGLDRKEQAAQFSQMRCQYGQGEWFGPPMDVNKVTQALRKASAA